MANNEKATRQILQGSEAGQKSYGFDEEHDPSRPADFWFQQSQEGEVLFVVFYSQACRWSRCLGCNLPSRMSSSHVDFKALMAQVDWLINEPSIVERRARLSKVIVSNNGSIMDEETFSSTALMYLIARLNQYFTNLSVLCVETRAEYVDPEELEFIARALKEGDTPTMLEVAIGFEAFDETIRNKEFNKGLGLKTFEGLCAMIAKHRFRLKCYFMQKPIPGLSDQAAVDDIHQAIDYLDEQANRHGIPINMHLNPTYVAKGTLLVDSFLKGEYSPPKLTDVVRAVSHARDKRISVYVGLSDEGLAVKGGSFIRSGDEVLLERLERFNRSQDYALLDA